MAEFTILRLFQREKLTFRAAVSPLPGPRRRLGGRAEKRRRPGNLPSRRQVVFMAAAIS